MIIVSRPARASVGRDFNLQEHAAAYWLRLARSTMKGRGDFNDTIVCRGGLPCVPRLPGMRTQIATGGKGDRDGHVGRQTAPQRHGHVRAGGHWPGIHWKNG